MKRMQILLAAACAATLVFAGSALAAGDTGTVTLSASVAAKAALTLSGNTAPNFDLSTVDNGTAVTATGATTVAAKVRTGATQNPTLTVQAGGDFVNSTYAGNDIPASDVTWAATGNLIAGILSKAAPVTVNGAWTGSNTYTGDMTWTLANNSNYSTGTYSNILVTYTLTAP
ncbi:hypothetical protein [Geomobilimonas luticola]|uniref:WxL domain-containing protein n=1 Tax=Geomobilimonas luticola TaxID=1114878 RepID=A0ABS5SFI7_9BACT|nr:hypothetical protein [Geomobilimonas luticola]MBT0653279.1 hypothetical protein [Geomobilimonas luticola]